ncbi:MAG TPA: hypothetical protein VI457_13790 [Methylococcaceae bacterium]|nr:hypothetical protein [Methylococcaceae bacterium]
MYADQKTDFRHPGEHAPMLALVGLILTFDGCDRALRLDNSLPQLLRSPQARLGGGATLAGSP